MSKYEVRYRISYDVVVEVEANNVGEAKDKANKLCSSSLVFAQTDFDSPDDIDLYLVTNLDTGKDEYFQW